MFGCDYYVAIVVVVFTLNRAFYPTSSAVHPVSVLILHPREIQIMWSQTDSEKNEIVANKSRQCTRDLCSLVKTPFGHQLGNLIVA